MSDEQPTCPRRTREALETLMTTLLAEQYPLHEREIEGHVRASLDCLYSGLDTHWYLALTGAKNEPGIIYTTIFQ